MLYCDFDATLHPGAVYRKKKIGLFLFGCPGHSLFEHAPLLETLLEPYPDVSIVLLTNWVQVYRGSIARVANYLPPGLVARVVGATYHSRMDRQAFTSASRGEQVWSDVLRRRPSAWLAIDDDAQDCAKLVQTKSRPDS